MGQGGIRRRLRSQAMPTTLHRAVELYLRAKNLSRGTRAEYLVTLRKWDRWGASIPIEELTRRDVREFLDRVYEHAVTEDGRNPGPRPHGVLQVSWTVQLLKFRTVDCSSNSAGVR